MINRQLRNWIFVLYPDNPKHMAAMDIIDLMPNSLYIKHNAESDDLGNELHKEHFHCLLRYTSGYWLSTLLNDLNLDEEDAHLFHSFKDFKRFRTLNDYVLYLDHLQEENKPDKYSPDDFCGSLKSWAIEILQSREKDNYEKFFEMCKFIKDFNRDHFFDTRTFTFNDWFELCIENGYGQIFFSHWFKMRDILRPYLNY